ncbi:MAG: thiamine diphosphokinase [Oscillospiraceae bacterium]
MCRCVVVCAGERSCADFIALPGDFVICCDDGLSAARQIGLTPDLLIGDFDSLTGPLPPEIETLRFPVEKDDTDSMLAVREGLRRGYRDFILLFSLGGRLDHTIANVQTLAFLLCHGASGRLVGPRDEVFLLHNTSVHLPRRTTHTLSLFAWNGAALGVTLRGVQYPLTDHTLTSDFPLGVGNSIIEEEAILSVTDGTLLVICSAL